MENQIIELIKGKGRVDLLRFLIENSDKEFTISELSRVTGVPFGTTWYAIRDWEKNEIVESKKVGKAKVVKIGKLAPTIAMLIGLSSGDITMEITFETEENEENGEDKEKRENPNNDYL